MPQTIGNHGLYCPQFDDYAAVALYMQDLGTRIDAELDAQRDALNSFLSPPTLIVTNAVNKTIPVTSSIFDVFDTVLFNNSTFMTYDFVLNSAFIGSQAGAPVVVPYRRGAYTAGITMRMTASGAVTVGSERRLSMSIQDQTAGFGSIVSSFTDSSFDMNTGGDEGLNTKVNFVLNGTSGVEYFHVASSDNAASTTTVLAGALMWVTYNGPTDIIEVA